MRGLRVLLLGQGRLEFDGQPLTRLMATKQQALVYLLAAAGEPLPRARIAALLWGEHDEAAARASLRVALTRLRRWLPGLLDIDDHEVAFAPDAPLWVDWQVLRAALSADVDTATRETAAQLWRGPLLDGLDIAGSDGFEHWLAQSRQRALQDAQALRRALLAQHEARGDTEAAIVHARGLLEIDETDEPAHMALMRLLATLGRRTAALAQYEACRAVLLERLGARPSAACYALYAQIHRQGDGGLVATATSQAHAPPAPGPGSAGTAGTAGTRAATAASAAAGCSPTGTARGAARPRPHRRGNGQHRQRAAGLRGTAGEEHRRARQVARRIRRRHHALQGTEGRQVVPELPKPPAPRWLSVNCSTTSKRTCTTGTITICAIRSPGAIVNAVAPRFQHDTITCPW